MRFRLIFRARVMWADHFCYGSYRGISKGNTNKQFKDFAWLQWLLATYESSPCAYIFRCPTNECSMGFSKNGECSFGSWVLSSFGYLGCTQNHTSSIRSHSLDLVVGQVILPFTQQEDCYRGDSNPLLLYLIERRNLSLQSRVKQRLCQSITRRIFFELAKVVVGLIFWNRKVKAPTDQTSNGQWGLALK